MQATFLTEKHPSRHPLGRSFSLGSVPVDVGLLMPFSGLDLTQSCDQGYFPRRVRGRGEGEPRESIPNSSAVVLSGMAEGFLGDSACLFFCQAGGCSLRTCHSRGLTPSLQGSTASGQKSSTVRGEGTACARGRPVTQSIRKGLGGWSLWQVDIQCLGGGPGTCLLPPLHLGLTLIVSLPFLSHGHHPLPESPPYHVAVGVGIWGGASGLQK